MSGDWIKSAHLPPAAYLVIPVLKFAGFLIALFGTGVLVGWHVHPDPA